MNACILSVGESTKLVDQVGLFLFAIYLVVVTIVLVNILIAMMSHSFEDVQVMDHSLLKLQHRWINLPPDVTPNIVPKRMYTYRVISKKISIIIPSFRWI